MQTCVTRRSFKPVCQLILYAIFVINENIMRGFYFIFSLTLVHCVLFSGVVYVPIFYQHGNVNNLKPRPAAPNSLTNKNSTNLN